MTAPIVAQNVTKRYGEVLGLNGFSATFNPGITALIGPNGAGKSTFFRLITGQLRADGGMLQRFGENPWGRPPHPAEIGYCPEHPAVYGWMTGFEFVEYLLRLDGFSREEARARTADAIEQVGLTDAAHRHLRGYSKGMRQRVKIAQAIAHRPKLLLLDEPLNGLDPLGRVRLLDLFERYAASGGHLVVSSHVLYEVERLTEEIVMVSNGRVLAEGNVHRLRDALDAHPHSIEIRTAESRRLGQLLSAWDHVLSVQFQDPDRLTVRTRAPDVFYQALPRLVTDESLSILEMSSPDDNLESVFRYLAE
ncbi:MAG: ABC transporter ATP-binding protein [Thermoplasmata archaeon]|nr:ABC transporter ATP-binding protein [Thermoplasmata archaeon]